MIHGLEDSLEKKIETHSSILAWRIPGTEEPDRLHAVTESDTTKQLTLLLPPNSNRLLRYYYELLTSLSFSFLNFCLATKLYLTFLQPCGL